MSELQNLIKDCEKYIDVRGIDETIINAYLDTCQLAKNDGDITTMLECTARSKTIVNQFCLKQFGMDIWEIEKFAQANNTEIELVNQYYQILKLESYDKFESFIFYMEKNRAWQKRFYQPRRKTLNVVAQDLEDLEQRKIKFYGLSMPSRVGKAISFDTPVLTEEGWKKHGDLTIRDRVIGIDGEFKRILAIHNPCEMEYKVTFSDGENIICHGNHEWVVYDRHLQREVTYETKFLKDNLFEKDGRKRMFLPDVQEVQGSHKPLWVDPYTLGAWLGDGRNTNPDICGAESDYAIVQKILSAGYELSWNTKHKTTGVRYYGFKGLREQLQKYGMCHSRHTTLKHIPDEYLIADEEQRLELLAGLLDTDGCLIEKENRYQFTTSDFFLKEDFVTLVNTFRWRTSVKVCSPKTSSSGIQGKKNYWVISFNPTKYIPCQLERKQINNFSAQRRISIEKIEEIPRYSSYGNCITVEDGIYCVGKTLKPTHNSTICIFFLAWIMLRRPNSHSAMGGHSGILAKGFYKELMNLVSTPEYTFGELFGYYHPKYKSVVTDKSADEFTITLGDPDRFATITCRGIDGTWTGAVDVSADGYLYVDDLVRDREHSLSPTRMENTYQEYLNKMVDRKNDGARELMVGTLWNVLDPLERLRKQYEKDPQYRFRQIPALNENDESNFNYEINGFSTEYYRDMRDKLDNAEWMAKFMQKPYVREGLLFPTDSLRYFNGVLPDGDCRHIGVTDIAWGGGDSLSMPIGVEYDNGDVYIIGWVFNKGTKEVTVPLVVGRIIENGIRQTRFEGNVGGDLYCQYVDEKLQEQGYKCSCSSRKAPNKVEKLAKIIAYSGDVKRKFIFLDTHRRTQEQMQKDAELGIKRYYRDDEYQAAMDELTMFVSIGGNEHDDAADGITQLEMFIENPENTAVAEATLNPFRRY